MFGQFGQFEGDFLRTSISTECMSLGGLGPGPKGILSVSWGLLGSSLLHFIAPGSFQALGRLLLYLLWSLMGSQICEKSVTSTKKHGLCVFMQRQIQDSVWVPV